MSEKLRLQWNDFKANVNSAFGKLRSDEEFTDVTLACGDGDQIEAHKVILAASSPFFEKILLNNKHPHPLIYLKGFQSKNLGSIIDFIYFGEANVYKEDVDCFLAIAEELKLKGLTRQHSNTETNEETATKQHSNTETNEQTDTKEPRSEEKVKCKTCDKLFANKPSMRSHVSKQHRPQNGNNESNEKKNVEEKDDEPKKNCSVSNL